MALSLVAVLALTACDGGCSKEQKAVPSEQPPAAAEDAAAPTSELALVVVLTVDQLPSWTFNRDRAVFTGGLKRLIDSGVLVPEAEFPYANTYTAPGHATIATGAPPSDSGILANSWYRPGAEKPVSCVTDRNYAVHGIGRGDELGVSPRALRVDGLADVLRRESPRSRSVAISLKDRGAILLLGRRPDLAIWYEGKIPGMTTSTYYAPEMPEWLRAFNGEQPVSKFYRSLWEPLDAELLERITGLADDNPGEGQSFGFDRTFPHDLSETDEPTEVLRMTPVGTELVFSAARAAIAAEKLGQDAHVDLLGMSISSHDYAGHYWGQESWERLDLLLRLDRELGAFLEHLDEAVGRDRYAVVVTSDHGANPLVEQVRKLGQEAHRVSTLRLVQMAREAANEVLGPGDWVQSCSASTMYLSDRLKTLSQAKKDEAIGAIVDALSAIPGVGYVKPASELAGDCRQREGLDALACRSITDESGQIFVAPTFGSLLSGGYQTGTGHGSPSREDRFVPIIVSRPGIAPRVVKEPVSMLQVAPTVAELLGVAPPPAARLGPIELGQREQ